MLRWCIVGGALYVRVAAHACEHAAVDRVFEGLRINMQADGFTIDLVRQGRITVTGQALVDGRFRGPFLGRGLAGDGG